MKINISKEDAKEIVKLGKETEEKMEKGGFNVKIIAVIILIAAIIIYLFLK